MQENLVSKEILVFGGGFMPGKLACMDSIHARIKQLRKALGWSYQRLADEVSKLEGLVTPLAWTAVQQWERENGTAPKRTRLPFVAQALGTTVKALLEPEIKDLVSPAIAVNEHPSQYIAGLPRAVEIVVDAFALLTPSAWAMVRGALDTVVGHPEMGDEVAANVLMVLQAGSSKRVSVAQVYRLPCRRGLRNPPKEGSSPEGGATLWGGAVQDGHPMGEIVCLRQTWGLFSEAFQVR